MCVWSVCEDDCVDHVNVCGLCVKMTVLTMCVCVWSVCEDDCVDHVNVCGLRVKQSGR